MKLTNESKVLLAIVAATIVIIGIAAVVFTKPAPQFTRDDLVPASAHTTGNRQASVYLVEFSDFQCPACKAAQPIVEQIIRTYNDRVFVAYRHFPLGRYPFAQKAAEAAEAAAAQGKFWEYAALLFANQEKIDDTLFPALAKELGLDEAKFTQELASGTYRDAVLSDVAAGSRFGVNATPTFFLNGKKLELTSFTDLLTAVNEVLPQ